MRNLSLLFAAVIWLASSVAAAAPMTELKVQGTIKAKACSFSIANNGYVTYDLIPSAKLATGSFTALDTKEVEFSITCDLPMALAVKITDNRLSSKVAGTGDFLFKTVNADQAMFGLGQAAGKNIGAYRIELKNIMGDGSQLKLKWGASGAWYDANPWVQTNYLFSWGTEQYTAGQYKSISGKMAVTPVLNKRENLQVDQEINFDGSTTFELIYL